MEITLIHPSKGRPIEALAAAGNWLSNAERPVEYILAIDETERDLYLPMVRALSRVRLNPLNFTLPCAGSTAIEAINAAARIASGDLLVVMSDDFTAPAGWDTQLKNQLAERSDFCAKTPDGHQDWLITLPIMDRAYYERFGYIYYPGYAHMFADLEMTSVAWMLDKYINLGIDFRHNHYSVTGREPDETNRRNNRSWGFGQRLYRERRRKNFGLVPVKELPELKQHFV